MEVLYAYISSPQFAGRLKSLYDGFVVMRDELEAEKAAFPRIWKKREAQLTRMQDGLLSVVGDLQGIGEEAVPALEAVAALPAAEQIGLAERRVAAGPRPSPHERANRARKWRKGTSLTRPYPKVRNNTKVRRRMAHAVLTSKGQITIPKEVREALGVDTGDRLEFVQTGKGVYELIAASKDVRELKGMIGRPRRPVSVGEMRKAVARRANR